MKPPQFDYVRADSIDQITAVLREAGADARILAGGQSLLPMLNMRLVRPGVLIDIARVGELRRLDSAEKTLRIGAAVRQAELQALPDLQYRHPLLAAVLPLVGHTQTRNRGTVCGSIAHADPSAELPLVLVALGGEIHLRSHRRARRLTAETFFTGTLTTARHDDELIEAVSFPSVRPGHRYAFREVARRHGDFAVVACAAVTSASSVRLAVGGVADRPIARDLPASGPVLEQALDAFASELDARDDLHATAAYRRELVRRIGRAVIAEAVPCCG